jgi:hypothetical protein
LDQDKAAEKGDFAAEVGNWADASEFFFFEDESFASDLTG